MLGFMCDTLCEVIGSPVASDCTEGDTYLLSSYENSLQLVLDSLLYLCYNSYIELQSLDTLVMIVKIVQK